MSSKDPWQQQIDDWSKAADWTHSSQGWIRDIDEGRVKPSAFPLLVLLVVVGLLLLGFALIELGVPDTVLWSGFIALTVLALGTPLVLGVVSIAREMRRSRRERNRPRPAAAEIEALEQRNKEEVRQLRDELQELRQDIAARSAEDPAP